MPVTLKVKDNKLIFNDTTSITFHRTLRIPDDGKVRNATNFVTI